MWTPFLTYLAWANEIGRLDEAWTNIREAMTAVETTKERWCEAEINRIAGEVALLLPDPDTAKAGTGFARALEVARKQQAKGVGAPGGDEHGAASSRSGEVVRRARAPFTDLWLVHAGVGHSRPAGGQDVAGRTGAMSARLLEPKKGLPKDHEIYVMRGGQTEP